MNHYALWYVAHNIALIRISLTNPLSSFTEIKNTSQSKEITNLAIKYKAPWCYSTLVLPKGNTCVSM